jgi:hypothetical protein
LLPCGPRSTPRANGCLIAGLAVSVCLRSVLTSIHLGDQEGEVERLAPFA